MAPKVAPEGLNLRLRTSIYVTDENRNIASGDHVVGETISPELAQHALDKGWARKLTDDELKKLAKANGETDPDAIDLSDDDESIKSALAELSNEQRDAFWKEADQDAMARILVDRAGKTFKPGWTSGSMGNMIEKHVGL